MCACVRALVCVCVCVFNGLKMACTTESMHFIGILAGSITTTFVSTVTSTSARSSMLSMLLVSGVIITISIIAVVVTFVVAVVAVSRKKRLGRRLTVDPDAISTCKLPDSISSMQVLSHIQWKISSAKLQLKLMDHGKLQARIIRIGFDRQGNFVQLYYPSRISPGIIITSWASH